MRDQIKPIRTSYPGNEERPTMIKAYHENPGEKEPVRGTLEENCSDERRKCALPSKGN
jgi:hypothetical protein